MSDGYPLPTERPQNLLKCMYQGLQIASIPSEKLHLARSSVKVSPCAVSPSLGPSTKVSG